MHNNDSYCSCDRAVPVFCIPLFAINSYDGDTTESGFTLIRK
jgi:hypothetical protein